MEAKTALQSVREAEEKARILVENAKEQAEAIANESISSANEQYNAMITKGQIEKKKIKNAARVASEHAATEVIEKGLKDAEAIRHIDDEKLNTVVHSIVKGIVNNNGNR